MAWRKTLKGKWSSYSSYSELNSDHHQLSSWEHIKENQQIVDLNSKMVAIFALFHNIWSPTPHPPPPIKLGIILTILLIGSQLSIVPSLYFIGDNRFPLHSPWKSCDPPNPATTSPFPPQGGNTDWSQSKAFIYRGNSPSNFWLTIQQTVRRFIFISENHYCLMLQLK